MSIDGFMSGKGGDAPADLGVAVDVHVAAEYHEVAADRSFQSQVSRVASDISVHVARYQQRSRRGNHIAQNMAGYFDVPARYHQVTFDGAFHADSSSGSEQISVDDLVFRDRQSFLVAKLRRRRSRRHRQHGAQSREDQRQRRTAPEPTAEEHGSQP